MTTLFLATEADEGMGHVAPWAGFLSDALERGMQVHMAAPNVRQMEALIGCKLAVTLWQAPLLRSYGTSPESPAPKSWPELLVSLGYAEGMALTAMVKSWISVLRGAKPDIVLADYAPALMVAARILKLPCLEVGSGFCVPPLTSQGDNFPGASRGDAKARLAAALALTTSINAALHACRHPHLLKEFADIAHWPLTRMVLSPPELDHYGPRGDIVYTGCLGLAGLAQAVLLRPCVSGRTLSPPIGDQEIRLPRVLGYLKPTTPGLTTLIAALQNANVATCLVIPKNKTRAPEQLGSVTLIYQAIDLPGAMANADIYLSNGGLSGIGLALAAGCWPIVVPMQAEQVSMVRNLIGRQLGELWLAENQTLPLSFLTARVFSKIAMQLLEQQSQNAEKIMLQIIEDFAAIGR